MMKFKIGECISLFVIAVVFDVVGFVLLLLGIFGNLRISGQFYGDFLIYTGSIVIFISIAFWLCWYVGNIKLTEEDLDYDEGATSFSRLVRKLSEKLNPTLKRDPPAKFLEEGADNGEESLPPRKASRVTWGKSSAYQNEGYDASLDSESHAVEKGSDTGLSDETSTATATTTTTTTEHPTVPCREPVPTCPVMDCCHKKNPNERCALFLVLALIFDLVGLGLLLAGIFAPISFWDFFILSGPLLIFLSLIFWIFWYMGGLTVPYEDLLPK